MFVCVCNVLGICCVIITITSVPCAAAQFRDSFIFLFYTITYVVQPTTYYFLLNTRFLQNIAVFDAKTIVEVCTTIPFCTTIVSRELFSLYIIIINNYY